MARDKQKRVTLSGNPPTDPTVRGAPGPIDPATGMHTDYWVLSPEELAKGFVRPVRDTYVHVGPPGPRYPLRDLTEDEKARHSVMQYVQYETYPEEESPKVGQFWTQGQLDKVDKGCGSSTKMHHSFAETYARDPRFYGSTFCVNCGKHYPVDEFVWAGSKERVGS